MESSVRAKAAPRRRAFALGLDGVPHSLLTRLIERGVVPHIARLVSRGGFVSTETTIPEISNVAWASIVTGKNPGEHGVYGFVDLLPGSYRLVFPNQSYIKAPALWDEIGNRGRRTIALNVPGTYPARPIPGVQVSGFVAIDLARSVQPPSLLPTLQEIGYRIDVDTVAAHEDKAGLARDLTATLDARAKTIFRLMDEEPWDLFFAVITGTDRLHHFLWDAWEDEGHEHHAFFLDYYRRVDDVAGEILDRLDAQATFLMFSDHGFGRADHEVYVNTWLAEQGYLAGHDHAQDALATLSSDSRAFALDPGRIYVHTAGRWPNGSVNPSGARAVVDEIAAKARAWTGPDGRPVVRLACKGAELYRGPETPRAPDLVLVANQGFDLKGALNRADVFSAPRLSGMHTQNDSFFLSNRPREVMAPKHVTGIHDAVLDAID